MITTPLLRFMTLSAFLSSGLLTSGWVRAEAHAQNAVECENTFRRPGEAQVRVEIWQNSSVPSAYFSDASLTINPEQADAQRFDYRNVFARLDRVMNQINFTAAGFNLDIRLFPDVRPQVFKDYDSSLRSRDRNSGVAFSNLKCRFYY